MSSKRIREGDEALAKAEKLLSTSMFRWSPDYMGATPYLEKAAEAYQAGKDLEKATKAFVKLAEVQHKNGAVFRAAMHMETAAKLHLQFAPKHPQTAIKYYQVGCSYYSEMGELGKAAEMLMKGAAAVEAVGMTDVKNMYLEACDLMESQDKPHFAVDVFRKTAAFLVKRKEYADAVLNYERQIQLFKAINQKENMYKAFASIVVLKCVMQDVVAADQAYMQFLQDDGFLSSDECALSEDLINALKRSDDALLQVVLKKHQWQYMDTCIGRLVRTISLYGSGEPKPSHVQNAAPISKQASFPAPTSSKQQPTTSIKNVTPAPAPSAQQTSNFSFDDLQFSSSPAVDTASAIAALNISTPAPAPATTVVPTPAPAPKQVPAEEDMFDLT